MRECRLCTPAAVRRSPDVLELLRGDVAGARDALRTLLGGEPLRLVASGEGYRLEGRSK
jgi:hypothetical protein